MPTELLLAPVGAGKTEYAMEQVRSVVESQPFAPIWVLLPGRRQEDAMRQRLVEQSSERRVYFNVSFFSFYTLYARLLDIVGKPQRELDDTGRVRLLRGLLSGLKQENQLTVFHRIADKPGFAQVMADFIYELKQNLVSPEDFQKYADYGTDKDRDLATVYTQYQYALRDNKLVDREGEGWLALQEVRANTSTAQDIAFMLVDGFDQFNPLQTRLLALLSGRVKVMLITLPIVTGRENTVGRRFNEVRQKLVTAFEQEHEPLTLRHIRPIPEARRHEGLRHIAQYSFMNNAPLTAGGGCLKLIEAPDPRTESFAVMRQIKRLLLAGTSGDELLVAVRDEQTYAPHLSSAANRYGIPTILHFGDALANNPAIIALMNALELSRYDFLRREVLDALRSPYFAVPGIDHTAADRLDMMSQEQQIIGGKNDWLTGLQTAAAPTTDEDKETKDALFNLNEAAVLKQSLQTFFAALTPPQTASVHDYIVWIEDLIGNHETPDTEPIQPEAVYSLDMLRQINNHPNNEFVGRDMQAVQALKRVLRGMLATENLFAEVKLVSSTQTTWVDFLSDLKRALGRTPAQNSANRSGHVLITSVTDARGLPHEHIFIPGLSEGIFPRPTAEDPIYLDSERQLLRRSGILLETQAERAADDGLFYELISLPRKSLTLSRPTIQNGAIWSESHLWRAIKVVISDADDLIERDKIGLGSAVRAEEAADRTEASLAVADEFSRTEATLSTQRLYNWLIDKHTHYWQRIIHNRRMEIGRINDRRLDRYSGKLDHPELIAWVANELGQKRIWSASQFNDYGSCGFRFFTKRLLKLEAFEEPEAGMDNRQRGTVIHALLEDTYRELAERAISIIPEHLDVAITILRTTGERILTEAPQRFGFRESPLWAQERVMLMRKVEALVRNDFSEDSPIHKAFKGEDRIPYLLEQPLGGDHDKPLSLQLGSSTVKVSGYIDRIDRIGDRLVVLDYKSGTTPIPTSEMTDGRNFQMMVYLLAGQDIISREQEKSAHAPISMAGGAFLHINRKTSGVIDMDDPDDQAAIDDARLLLGKHIQEGRKGNFGSVSSHKGGGACTHYCEYTQFCRVSTMNRRKQ